MKTIFNQIVERIRATFLLIIFLPLLLHSGNSAAQDSTGRITASWLKLKGHLQKRTDISTVLTAKLIKEGSKTSKKEYEYAKQAGYDLLKYIDTISLPDIQSIQLIRQKNAALTGGLSRALALLENETKLKSDPELRTLIMQLEASENRIYRSMQDFNKVCTETGRPELMFRFEGTDGEPGVRF